MAACAVLVALTLFMRRSANRELDTLRPKAKRGDAICAFVRVTLRTDLRIIEEEPNNRDRIIARINGTTVGDDAQLMDMCMSTPFDAARWRDCRATSDFPCLSKLLREAIQSIDTEQDDP